MEAIRIRGGHRFRITNAPSTEKRNVAVPAVVGLTPRGVPGLKPKILVKAGDKVERGQILFHDKRRPQVGFPSPAGGTVQDVRFGPRRKLEAVLIALDASDEPVKDFGSVEAGAIASLGRDKVIEKLVASGLWSRLTAFPGWGVAPLPGETVPPAEPHGEPIALPSIRSLYVSALSTEPHQPDPAVAVEGHEALFAAGLEALRQVPLKNTFLITKTGGRALPSEATGVAGVEHRSVDDRYPAENVGLHVYYTQPLNKGEVAAGVSVEDVIDIGHLFLKGTLRAERTFAIGGNAAKEKLHLVARQGIFVKDLVGTQDDSELRFIAGGLFTGTKVSAEDVMSPNDRALQMMGEDRERTPFALLRLGFQHLTLFRTWGAGFFPDAERDATTSNHGEERACVQCHACIDVCPVELMPNLVFKAALEQDIEKMEKTFIHDCVDCGLCTFVCPSKIELAQHIEDGKNFIVKEG